VGIHDRFLVRNVRNDNFPFQIWRQKKIQYNPYYQDNAAPDDPIFFVDSFFFVACIHGFSPNFNLELLVAFFSTDPGTFLKGIPAFFKFHTVFSVF
jgi:hypothetical protein